MVLVVLTKDWNFISNFFGERESGSSILVENSKKIVNFYDDMRFVSRVYTCGSRYADLE